MDLRRSFPEVRGFSVRNLERMRGLAVVYSGKQFPAQLVPQLPWSHIILLIQKVKSEVPRQWYAQKAIEQGWSREHLRLMIAQDLYERQGVKANKIANFEARMVEPNSELAMELMQDPVDFGFLPITQDAKEREIELSLVNHVRDVLLHLGKGFSFVDHQHHISVGGEDFFIDLLLFNIELNCYVVVELKKGKFKPEHAGKLNFYLSIVDDLIKKPHHKPSLGLLLCESRNRIIAEYALERTESPMGIARYQLSKEVPEALKSVLPSAELLEEKLNLISE